MKRVAEDRAIELAPVAAEKIANTSQAADRRLGNLLLESKKINIRQIDAILAVQREQSLRFGEAALKLGFVRNDDLLQALAQQFEYPCIVDDKSKLSPRLVVVSQPFHQKAERYRALRSDLMLSGVGSKTKSLAIVPVQTSESAIDNGANLALAFAQLGERTLLIDANMREPCLHELFRIKAVPGLSDVLIGRTPLMQAVAQVDAFPSLSILCAGATPPNPQELLSRSAFSSLLEIAARIYSVVILVAPAADRFADAQIIAARAGSCVLAVELHKSRFADVERVKRHFESSRISIAGAVIAG